MEPQGKKTMANDKKSDMASDIRNAIKEGTKDWTRVRKSEERNPSSRSYRAQRLYRERGVQFKEAAAEIMEAAYMEVSGNGQLPANARQIMYKARPHIQKRTNKQLEPNYFAQTLLPNFVQETGVDWDVVYDARGHFTEPHGGNSFGIGTLDVRNYLAGFNDPSFIDAGFSQGKVETKGPSGSFGAVLFVEKEGFDPILKAAQIANKYDIAIMSTKGMSVTAARALADEMCSKYDIPLFILRDFDKAGFSIASTLQRDTRRYEFKNSFRAIELGLSLADVEAMGLEPEYQHHPKGKKSALIGNLRTNGATEAEINFMFRDFDTLRSTRRVELNAMTSPQFVAFVERKLLENGVAKIVPEQELLAEIYTGMERGRRLEEAAEDLEKIDMEDFEPPKDLEKRVRKMLKKDPAMRWDAAVAKIVAAAADDEGDAEGEGTRSKKPRPKKQASRQPKKQIRRRGRAPAKRVR
jgi:hypothetical protein